MSTQRDQVEDVTDDIVDDDQVDDDLRDDDDLSDERTVAAGRRTPGTRGLGWLLLVGGVIGFLASFDLVVEGIQLLIDPTYVPSCSINPLLSCGSVMQTDQASVFGFSNPILGVAGFAAVTTVGAALLAGARFRPWFWRGLVTGAVLGAAFMHWLAYESVFVLGTLCPWCMAVWAVMLPITLYTGLHAAAAGHLGLGERGRSRAATLADYRVALLTAWYGLFVVVIALVFWDQWLDMLGLG